MAKSVLVAVVKLLLQKQRDRCILLLFLPQNGYWGEREGALEASNE